jgi:hypothetical protein
MSAVHTLTFRDDKTMFCLGEPSVRLELVAHVMETIGAAEPGSTVALPAGFVQAVSIDQRDQWATQLAQASRDAGVGTVFGIDVTDEERWGLEHCPRSFVFACDRGQPLLWAATPLRGDGDYGGRLVTIGAIRTLVLMGRELFAPGILEAAEEEHPERMLLLGHGGPTKKWLPRLAALDAIAPTVLVHQNLPVRRPVTPPDPRGWRATLTDGPVQVMSYRPVPLAVPVGAALPSWDTERP